MHHHPHFKAAVFCLAFGFIASLGIALPHQLEAKDTTDAPVVKQEVKKDKVKKPKIKKLSKKQLKELEEKKKAEENKAKEPEVKKEEPKKPAPPPQLTPDKKKYASPGGNQVMTDGTIIDFANIGVIFMHGYRYSYYSSNVLRHHRTHEWYACDDKLYRTADGYLVVASCDHPQGAIVPTPFGPGKVLDHCYVSGTIDIYVNF